METIESQQHRSVTHAGAEHSSAHMQTEQISVPTLAQVGHRQALIKVKMSRNENCMKIFFTYLKLSYLFI